MSEVSLIQVGADVCAIKDTTARQMLSELSVDVKSKPSADTMDYLASQIKELADNIAGVNNRMTTVENSQNAATTLLAVYNMALTTDEDGNLILCKSGSDFDIRLSDDRVELRQKGQALAYTEDDTFHVIKGTFDTFKAGNYSIQGLSDGSLCATCKSSS